MTVLEPRTPMEDTMSKPTALKHLHAEAGAHFIDFAGWRMPLRYDSELAEHHAVRQAAGLFDLSHMGEIEVTGPEAAAFLDYALVGDIGALAVTKARYTMICRPDGGILDDLIVYRLEDSRYMVVANAANSEVVLDALKGRAIGFDAEVHDSRDDWALIAIQGPVSAAVLQPVTDVDLEALRYYAIAKGQVAGRPARLARTGYTGEDGFEIFCHPGDAGGIWTELADRGHDVGVRPAGLACRDSLRLEAAMPLYGNELTGELSPFEAGLGRVVRFDKAGDFVGRQALEAKAGFPVTQVRVGLHPQVGAPRGRARSSWTPRRTNRSAGSLVGRPRRPWATPSRWRTSTRPSPSRGRRCTSTSAGRLSRRRSCPCPSTAAPAEPNPSKGHRHGQSDRPEVHRPA